MFFVMNTSELSVNLKKMRKTRHLWKVSFLLLNISSRPENLEKIEKCRSSAKGRFFVTDFSAWSGNSEPGKHGWSDLSSLFFVTGTSELTAIRRTCDCTGLRGLGWRYWTWRRSSLRRIRAGQISIDWSLGFSWRSEARNDNKNF